MIGPQMMKPCDYVGDGSTVRCLSCHQVFTLDEMEAHLDEFCFPPNQVKGSKDTAHRTELLHREPCWECSKALVNIHGKCSPPYVAYVATIQGFERKLHRRCAEGLGFKCINQLAKEAT
jgi:hypothetical protein